MASKATKKTNRKSPTRAKKAPSTRRKAEFASSFTRVGMEKASLGLTRRSTNEITELFVSSDVSKNIRDALKFRRGNELVQIIVETKLDFLAAGFRNHYLDDKSRDFYDNFAIKHDMDAIVTEIADDLLTCDNAILHWKIDEKDNIEYIMTLDPGFVEYNNVQGNETMKILLDPEMRTSIQKASPEQKKDIPDKYLKAGAGAKVELLNADGEYWMVLTTGRKFRGLVQPSMSAIFADLKLREMFVAGDWSVGFFAKAFIQLVKSGESATGSQHAGTKRLYQTPEANAALNNLMKDVSRAMRIVGDHTLTIEHIVPPTEAYSQDKYGHVETRVLRWGGIPKVIIEGAGGNYASGFLGKIKLFADIKRKRRQVANFIEAFYRQPTINSKALKNTPQVRFDEQILKDTKELVNELKLLLQYATGFSARSAVELLGHDADTELARKREEMKDPKVLIPIFEPNQGLLDEGGRPSGGNTPANDVSSKRGGRTSSSEDCYHIEIPDGSGRTVPIPKVLATCEKEAEAFVMKNYKEMDDAK